MRKARFYTYCYPLRHVNALAALLFTPMTSFSFNYTPPVCHSQINNFQPKFRLPFRDHDDFSTRQPQQNIHQLCQPTFQFANKIRNLSALIVSHQRLLIASLIIVDKIFAKTNQNSRFNFSTFSIPNYLFWWKAFSNLKLESFSRDRIWYKILNFRYPFFHYDIVHNGQNLN